MKIAIAIGILILVMNIVFSFSLIFIERKDPTTTWAWLLIMILLPGIGFIIYLLLGQNLSRERLFKEKTVLDENKRRELSIQFTQSSEGHSGNDEYLDLMRMNYNHSGAKYTIGNDIEIYYDGEDKFARLLEDLRGAKKYIHIQYYIFRKESIGREIIKVLEEKAAEGVEVRFLVDSMGSYKLTKRSLKKYILNGGKFEIFFPGILPHINTRINYRNHRKILIIDSKVAFLGGFNIGDEYLGKDKNIGHWRDTHTKIKGLAINDLEGRFLLDWSYANESDLDIDLKKYFINPHSTDLPKKIIGAQIVSSGPDHTEQQIKNGYFKIINSAKKNLFIQTPYFVPDEPMLEALRLAALSGVDVKIMLPGNPDHKFMGWIANSYFESLLNAGAKIYLYEKGFLHAKTIVADSSICSVGTANMDIRSFSLNFESNIFIYNEAISKSMEEQFFKDLKVCTKVTLESFEKRSIISRIGESIIRLVSPLM